MTTARLQRMRCPTCGRDVAARLVRGPRVNNGRGVPAMRVPVAHHNQLGEPCKPQAKGTR